MKIDDVDLTVGRDFSRGFGVNRSSVSFYSNDTNNIIWDGVPMNNHDREIYEAISSDYCDCCGRKIIKRPYELSKEYPRLCNECEEQMKERIGNR